MYLTVFLLSNIFNNKFAVKMNTSWISPKSIIGSVATGSYYYPRVKIVAEIWMELEKGNSILLAAPRRVGKTSIMRDIEQNPKEGYIIKFEIIQAVKSKEEFYEALYNLILGCLSSAKKAKTGFLKYLKSKSITEFDIKGKIKIENKNIDYLEEINAIFKSLDNNAETVVLLIDELPEVLHNINKAGKTEDASAILKQLRTWRQSDYKKLQFVLAGSIGIHFVVKAIEGRTSDLNDLNKVICEPLSKKQADKYIDWATEEATIKYDDKHKKYVLQKIQYYYTPYFINLMLDAIDKNGRKNDDDALTEKIIDNTFNAVVNNNDHFNDWKSRLVDYMPKADFEFLNEILIHVAHKNFINVQAIYNKAVQHNKTTDYMELISGVVQDGYIVEEPENSGNYIFISPFLKTFWLRNNPIYNG
jgi:uncharacterized protein